MPYFGVGMQTVFDFNTWYLDNLPQELRDEAELFVRRQYERVFTAYRGEFDVKSQYYMPLGTNVISKHKAPLSAFLYMIELRSNKGVHPILRKLVHKLHERLLLNFDALNIKNVPVMYIDTAEDDFSIKRGNATITDASGNQID
jgi:hypothetical protein